MRGADRGATTLQNRFWISSAAIFLLSLLVSEAEAQLPDWSNHVSEQDSAESGGEQTLAVAGNPQIDRPWISVLPPIEFSTDWLPNSGDDLGMTTVRLGTQLGMPLGSGVIGFGPSLRVHFLDAGPGVDAPDQLYDIGLQGVFVRKLNDRWMTQFMLGPVIRSDFQGDGETIDVIGIGMARWQASPRLAFMFGAVATGVEEFPVAPLLGLQYAPNDSLIFELMVPQPKISARLFQTRETEYWGYLAGKFGGGRWQVLRNSGESDELRYNDFRLVVGLESRHEQRGTSFLEVGYVFGRDLEFESGRGDRSLDDTVSLSAGFRW